MDEKEVQQQAPPAAAPAHEMEPSEVKDKWTLIAFAIDHPWKVALILVTLGAVVCAYLYFGGTIPPQP